MMFRSPHEIAYSYHPQLFADTSLPAARLNLKLISSETDRIRYARAIAEESGFGHEFNLFSDDEITPEGNIRSYTQIRLSPDQTVRVHNLPHPEEAAIPEKFFIEKISEQGRLVNSSFADKEDLEKLVRKHVLRAGTIKERIEAIRTEVNTYSLEKLFTEFSKNPYFKPVEYSTTSIDLSQLGRHAYSNRINSELRKHLTDLRLGLCLPHIVTKMAVENNAGLRSWTKQQLDQIPAKTTLSRMLRWVLNKELQGIRDKVELSKFIFRFVSDYSYRIPGGNSANLSWQLLRLHKHGLTTDISNTVLE